MRRVGLISGAICIGVGIYLIVASKSSMGTTGEKIRKEFSGDYSSQTTGRMIGGIALVAIGAITFYYGLRK